MSVLKPKRNESSIEYIRLSNDLFSWSVNFVSRLSARYSRLLSERTINLASEVLECCVKANSTYSSCYEYAKMREFYLIKALGSLDALDVVTYYKDCTASSDDGILFTIYDGATNYVCLANTVTKEIIPNVGDPSDKKHVEYMCSYGEAFLKAYLH